MLTSVNLKNFKCFSSQELKLRPITVLIGPNGSGKSTILQALMLLRQSLGQERPVFRRLSDGTSLLIDLVGFEDCVYRRDIRRSVSIDFEATSTSTADQFPLLGESQQIACHYEVEMASRSGRLMVDRSQGLIAVGPWVIAGGWPASQSSEDSEVDLISARARFRPSAIIGKPMQFVGMSYASNSSLIEQQTAIAAAENMAGAISHVMDSWRFVPASRGFPYSSHPLQGQKTYELLPAHGYDEMAAQIASTLAYDEELEETVSKWIERITGVQVGHGLDEGPGATVRAVSRILGRNIPIVLEGFGTNQLTFLMFQIAAAQSDGLVGVEEPETHLHPLAISRLGDLFAEIAIQERKQLLLTTHSEHLLLSLLNNVAERKLSRDDLAIYYFTLGEGESVVRPVEVTPEGMVKGGLPGFFDAALEAQRRHLTAISLHK